MPWKEDWVIRGKRREEVYVLAYMDVPVISRATKHCEDGLKEWRNGITRMCELGVSMRVLRWDWGLFYNIQNEASWQQKKMKGDRGWRGAGSKLCRVEGACWKDSSWAMKLTGPDSSIKSIHIGLTKGLTSGFLVFTILKSQLILIE